MKNWILCLIACATGRPSFASPDIDSLHSWAQRFHKQYFSMENPLPGHEAFAQGITDKGETCRLVIYHESGFLSVSLNVNDSEEDSVAVTTEDNIKNLSNRDGKLDVTSGGSRGESSLNVEEFSDGVVKKASGKSSKHPEGIVCHFRSPLTT